PAEVYYALMQLERQGYVGEPAAWVAPEVAAFWSALDPRPATALRRLEASTVAVTALGGLEAAPFAAALAALGIRAGDEGALGARRSISPGKRPAGWCSGLGSDGRKARPLAASPWEPSASEAGAPSAERGGEAVLQMVVTDDYLRPELDA